MDLYSQMMINGLFDIDLIDSIIEKDDKQQKIDKMNTECAETMNCSISSSTTTINSFSDAGSTSMQSPVSNIIEGCCDFLEEFTDLTKIVSSEDDVFNEPGTSSKDNSTITLQPVSDVELSDYFHDHTYDHTYDLHSSESSDYRQKRDKNNMASRKSRLIRKEKNVELERIATLLSSQNSSLKRKISLLENVIGVMKQELLTTMVPAKKSTTEEPK